MRETGWLSRGVCGGLELNQEASRKAEHEVRRNILPDLWVECGTNGKRVLEGDGGIHERPGQGGDQKLAVLNGGIESFDGASIEGNLVSNTGMGENTESCKNILGKGIRKRS